MFKDQTYPMTTGLVTHALVTSGLPLGVGLLAALGMSLTFDLTGPWAGLCFAMVF